MCLEPGTVCEIFIAGLRGNGLAVRAACRRAMALVNIVEESRSLYEDDIAKDVRERYKYYHNFMMMAWVVKGADMLNS
jgi:hypothetical protein